MKNKVKAPFVDAEEYYIAEEYDYDPPKKDLTFETLYQIFDLYDSDDCKELEGVAELMREPETFVQKEEKRKKNRFLICNII